MANVFLKSTSVLDALGFSWFWSCSLQKRMPSVPVSAVMRGSAARWRLSLSSITALVRSDPSLQHKRALHLCYRATGVLGAGYILIIPLASRSSSLNVKLYHCWILMSLENTCCCWSPADGLCFTQRAGMAHFSTHSHICQPGQYSMLSLWRNGMTMWLILTYWQTNLNLSLQN